MYITIAPNNELGISEETRKLLSGVRQRNQLFLKRNAFQEDYLVEQLSLVRTLLQGSGVAVIMRTTEKEPAAMIVLGK